MDNARGGRRVIDVLKKSLSQNLIKDKNLLKKMVTLAGIGGNDTVVEIGAGHGDLTRALCEKAGHIFSVEIDMSFRERLDTLEKNMQNLSMIYGDILQVPLSQFAVGKKVKVVANIPYGITGPILFKLIHERACIESVFLTTQKEIGQRVVSKPHLRSYGALSVICQLTARAKILMTLKPGVFMPPPKVDSVYFSLEFREDSDFVDRDFIVFVKHCFENKRKYLRHALSKYYAEEEIMTLYHDMGFVPSARAEEISPEGFVRMYRQLHL